MSTTEETPPAAEIETTAPLANSARADAYIHERVLWALGAGLVPIPLLDLAAIAAVQVKLVNELSELYGVEFSADQGKKIISVLTASVGTGTLATGTVASILKVFPGIGCVGGAIALPAVAGASTYALGRVFVQHYESGGSLVDLDQEQAKAYFAKAYEEGKKVVAKVKANVADKF